MLTSQASVSSLSSSGEPEFEFTSDQRVVVCGVVLVVSCVVLFMLCVCVCDLFLFYMK